MKAVPLRDYVKQFGQEFVAGQLGCTQGNISQLIKKNAPAFVRPTKDGRVYAWVERPVGRNSKAQAKIQAAA